MTETEAVIIVGFGWYRPAEGTLRTTMVRQTWRNDKGTGPWFLADEERVSGDLGLLGESVKVVVPEREIERYARAREFPIIPCNLCGSQQHLQRRVVREMLEGWERDYPGRTEAIFSALQNVSADHLADPALFDFAQLERQRSTPT